MLHWCLNMNWRPCLKRLPLTLYNSSCLAATGYSKVSRGLHFPLEITGLCTSKECSEDSKWGQWKSRCAIHAGRQSNGKAFRYLKRVIVTPAVYLILAPLKRSFRHHHWAGLTEYTCLFRLALGYVFGKQSGGPCY